MSLRFELAGDGPAVVLLHAGICDRRSWDPQWDALREGHRVLRMDMPGFGESPLGDPPVEPADAVADLLDEHSIERATLVGASYGGRVALELAIKRPELAESLVLIGASLPDHEWSKAVSDYGEEEEEALDSGEIDRALEANLRMWVDGPEREPGEAPAEVRSAVAAMARPALELQAAADDLGEEDGVPDLGARLGEITAPALVLVGELDVEDMRRIASRLAAEIPDARLETIPGTAHLPAMERPDVVNGLVLDFLAQSA